MEKRDLDITIILIIAGSMCALGIFIGFGVTTYFYNQLQALIGFGALFALLTWLGKPSEILGFITKYINERKNEPKLVIEYDIEGNPSQYITEWDDVIDFYGRVKKRVLRIQILNDSDGVAENCKARFRILQSDNEKHPDHELKFLRWAQNDDIYMTIGAHSDESLNIVFSTDKKIHEMSAYVAHPDSINEHKEPREKDGFEIGNYVFEVRIDPEKGPNFSFQFRIDVTDNWENLSMSLIRTN